MAFVYANNTYGRLNDPIGYISSESVQAVAAMSAMPVPVGVFMNMTHPPPGFHHGGQQSGILHQGGLYGYSGNNMLTGSGQPPRLVKSNQGGSSLYAQSTSQNTQGMSSQSSSQSSSIQIIAQIAGPLLKENIKDSYMILMLILLFCWFITGNL